MKRVFLSVAMVGALSVGSTAQASPIYAPVGPQANVAIGTVTGGGWTLCFSSPYGSSGTSLATIAANCTGDLMMLAGGETNSQTLLTLAWAPELDVMFETGSGNTPHNANGTGWYFSPVWSWGFAPQGAPINRVSCDTAATTGVGVDATTPLRLCWHTSGNTLSGGWRVGAVDGLNTEPTGYTRYIFTASSSPTAVPEPGTSALLLTGLALVAQRVRSRRRRA